MNAQWNQDQSPAIDRRFALERNRNCATKDKSLLRPSEDRRPPVRSFSAGAPPVLLRERQQKNQQPAPVDRRFALEERQHNRHKEEKLLPMPEEEGQPPVRNVNANARDDDDDGKQDAELTNTTLVGLKVELAEMRSALDPSSMAGAAPSSLLLLHARSEQSPVPIDSTADPHQSAAASSAADLEEQRASLEQDRTALARTLRRTQRLVRDAAVEKTTLRVNVERLEAERDDYKIRYKRAEERNGKLLREQERLERLCVELRFDRADMLKKCQRRLLAAIDSSPPRPAQQRRNEQQAAKEKQQGEGDVERRPSLDLSDLQKPISSDTYGTPESPIDFEDPQKLGKEHTQEDAEPDRAHPEDRMCICDHTTSSPGECEICNESFSNYEDIYFPVRKRAIEKQEQELQEQQHNSSGSKKWRPKFWRQNSELTASTASTSTSSNSGSCTLSSTISSPDFGGMMDSLALDGVLAEMEEKRSERLQQQQLRPPSSRSQQPLQPPQSSQQQRRNRRVLGGGSLKGKGAFVKGRGWSAGNFQSCGTKKRR